MTQTKVLISVPNQHWIHKSVVIRALSLLNDKRHYTRLITPSHKPYVNNLHHIIKTVLKDGYDFWLNIDADNPPVEGNPLDLVELNKDIIGIPTPIWHNRDQVTGSRPLYWNAYESHAESGAYKEWKDKNGLQKVDAVGTGCILIARRVLEHPMMKAPFHRTWDEDGCMDKGNDISFCERARKAGFEIYCHWSYWCDHFSEMSMNSMHKSYRIMFDAWDKKEVSSNGS